MRTVLWMTAGCCLVAGAVGCGALGSATGGVTSATGAASGAQGALTGAQGVVKNGQTQVKGAKDAINGAAAPPAGAGDAGNADDTRLNATESALNAPLDDKVDYKGDKIDWRKFILLGKAGPAVFELHWDDEDSDLSLDVYNSFGDLIGRSPRRLEGTQAKRVVVNIDPKADQAGKGVYYARVTAKNKKDNSIYTLQVKYDDGQKKKKPEDGDAAAGGTPAGGTTAAGGNPPGGTTGANPAGNPAGGTTGAAVVAPPPSAPPVPFAQDPSKALGHVVGAYKDGGGWVFQIDRGSGAGIQSNMSGALLDGDDGDKLVEGGSFQITQVVSDSKSIARAAGLQKPIGRNKRVVINLK